MALAVEYGVSTSLVSAIVRGHSWVRTDTPGWSSRSLTDRFWSHVDKTDGCWIWTGAANRAGYGMILDRGVRRQATAVSYFMSHGRYPECGMCVLHHCDNPRCVKAEPDAQWPDGHLFIGTYADNNADMVAKGRHRPASSPGETNPRAKLTWAQVRTIRARYARPYYGLRRDLVREYGVSKSLIGQIVAGTIWHEERTA
jgi:hypothetical protein